MHKQCFNIFSSFYPIRQLKKNHFHLLTEGVSYESFYNLLHFLYSNIQLAHSFTYSYEEIF
ncbi:hypothetical protein CW304_07755 [Bacillus sp. UFRGS-B20]|nr:hypothetical protein CW304_07755 [Bacillus sp. UFRGS-B20]